MKGQAEKKSAGTIVVKRIKKGSHDGHSASWKIAYADFVTAMMAFFLLMWLLGSTTKGDLQGIADYFNSPLQVSFLGGSGSGDATSVIEGGGADLTKSAGQVKRGDNDTRRRRPERLGPEVEAAERQRMERLKQRLDEAVQSMPKLAEYRNQIRVEITPDGLRIQIVDDLNRPMFALGSSQVQPYMREILHEIGRLLNEVDVKIVLTGHTDATPYAGGERGYSNWELSADRANASRRELTAGGMSPEKVARVVGLAESSPLIKDNPRSELNRRISIIVLNKLAEDKLHRANGEIEAGSVEDPGEALPEADAAVAANASPAPAPGAAR